LSKYDVQPCDADDLVQDVLMTVAKDLRTFDHNGRKGAFRSWLRTILTHRIRYFWRSRGRQPQARADSDIERRIQQLEDPASELSAVWNWEHDWFIAQRVLALTEPNFEPQTWTAFARVTMDGARPEAVSKELGMSLNAVFIAKSRVLRRLRQEANGLIEASTGFS